MAITDELREYAQIAFDKGSAGRARVETIADRIDAEHEADVSTACRLAAVLDNDALAKRGYIALPLDADGETIRIGDRLDGYGKTIEVTELRTGRSGWVIVSRDGNAYVDNFAFTHHHVPTVEDVLREFADRVCNSGHQWGLDAADVIAEYAAKLRLAEGVDE